MHEELYNAIKTLFRALPQTEIAKLLQVPMQDVWEMCIGKVEDVDSAVSRRAIYLAAVLDNLGQQGMTPLDAGRWLYHPNPHLQGRTPATAFVDEWMPENPASRWVLKVSTLVV